MKILKNSTYEGMCQEIEDGKKKIQSLTEQVSTERNKHAAALKEKQDAQKDFDQQLKSKSEEIERLRRENAELHRKNREAEGELNNKKEELKTLSSDKAFYEREMNQAKEDFARVFADKEKIKNELEKIRKIMDAQELAKDDTNGGNQSKAKKASPAKKSKTTKE